MWSNNKRRTSSCLPVMLVILLLLPIWIAWRFVLSLFILPFRCAYAKCEVRKYWVHAEGENLVFRQANINELLNPKETTHLLG